MTTIAPQTRFTAKGDLLTISEIFLSFQGEGPSAGERAVFLRLAECNLTCTWCDTSYSWDWSRHNREAETRVASPAIAATEISTLAEDTTRLLVLTGGEPLLQQDAIGRTLEVLNAQRPNLRCEVETNGTITPSDSLVRQIHRFVVSPKLTNSGVRQRARAHPGVVTKFAAQERAILKIVVTGTGDLEEAAATAAQAGFGPERVWIMPQATDPQACLDLVRELAAPVLEAGFNLTSRQHLLIWGDARGR